MAPVQVHSGAAPLTVSGHDAARSHPVPAWLLSCLLHAVLLVLLALSIQAAPRGIAVEPPRVGGIVLVKNADGRPEFFSQSDGESADQLTAEEAAAASALPAAGSVDVDLSSILPGPQAALPPGEVGAGLLPDAGDFTAGSASTLASGGAARTKVFGVSGEGHRFVYIFDRSESMAGYEGRPLAAAKAELLASLADLESVHQFQIIFYNNEPKILSPLGPGNARMMFGSEAEKQIAADWVRGMTASGATRHMEALRAGIRMKPDVVFFLTDAAEPSLTRDELEEVRRLNANVGASIHTIEFGIGSSVGGANFLAALARQNNGQYNYVDVAKLPRR